MNPRTKAQDRGSASIEFIWLTILLLVPLVYMMLTVFEAQRASFAVTSASQAAGRAFVRAPDLATAEARAQQAAAVALANHDITGAAVTLRCKPNPADCLQPGSSVEVFVSVQQALPLAPSVLGDQLASITVDSTYTEPYGTYRPGRS